MDIGSLTASLVLDSSKAMAGMTTFERTMVTLVSRIDSQLTLMSDAMLKVGASARIMGNEAAAAAGKVAAATKAASSAQPSRLFVAGSSGTSVVPMPPTSAAPTVTPVVNEKPAVASLNRLNNSLSMTAQRFRTFGYLASITLTAPIVLMGKSILNLEKDYEYTMQKIVGLTSATQKVTDEWGKDILKLAPQLGKGPKELAEGMYFVASAGFTGAKAMEMMTLSAKAAESGLGDTKDIAQFLTSALNAYAGTSLTATKATDVLVAGVKYGKVEAAGFASAIGSVIPIASSMGVSLEQVVGTMAAMTLQGATAANAAVYLKGILNSLLKISPTNEAGKALHDLGSSAIELRNMLGSGPNGVMDVLLKVQGWAKTNPYLLNKVFGNIRSLTADLSLTGNHLRENQKVINLVVNAFGDLDYAVSAVSGTLKVRFDKAMSGLQSGVIKFGDSISKYIMPIIEGFVKLLNKLMSWFTNLSEPMKKIILGFIAFAAAVGPLSLLLSLHMYVINGLSKAYGLLSVSAGTAMTTMAAIAPEIAIFIGVFAGVDLILTKLFLSENNLNKMNKELNTTLSKEVFSLNSVFDSLANATNGTKERSDAIKLVNSEYGEYLNKLLTEKSTLADIYAAQTQATNALVANISVKKYTEELEKQKAGVAQATEDSFGKIMTAWANTFGAKRLGSFITGLNKAMDDAVSKGATSGLGKKAESLKVLEQFYNQYVEKLGAGAVKGLDFTSFSRAFYTLLPVMRETKVLTDELTTKIKGFGSIGQGSVESLMKATSTLSPVLAQIGKAFGSLGNSFMGGIYTAMSNVLMNIATSLGFVTNSFVPLNDVEDENTKATDRLAEAWRNAGNYIRDAADLIKRGVNKDFWTMMVPPKKEDYLKDYLGLGSMQKSKMGGFMMPNNKQQSYDIYNAEEGLLSIGNMQESWLKPIKPPQYHPVNTPMDLLANKNISGIQGTYTETAAVMKKLGDELIFVNMKSDALGITMGKHRQLFDVARAKMNAYSQALEDYLAIPVENRGPAWQGEVNKTIDALEKMQAEFDKIQAKRDFLNGIRDSFVNLFTSIMSGTENAGKALKNFANSVLQSFEKLLAENFANKLMKIFSSVASAASSMNSSGIPGGVNKSVGGGGGFNVMQLLPYFLPMLGLAKGGTIPPGYPNDSYPAMLSSGKGVLPAGFNGAMQLQLEPVQLTIKDNTLSGFIRKSDKKNSLY